MATYPAKPTNSQNQYTTQKSPLSDYAPDASTEDASPLAPAKAAPDALSENRKDTYAHAMEEKKAGRLHRAVFTEKGWVTP